MAGTNFAFNVLATVQTKIRKQAFTYIQHLGRAANEAGLLVDNYAEGVEREASVQPITRSMYAKMGLDFNKYYITILDTESIFDTTRDTSGDRVVFSGQIYKVNGKTDWQTSGNWNRVVCVRIGKEE